MIRHEKHDIGDDEIRVISSRTSSGKSGSTHKGSRCKGMWIFVCAVIIAVIVSAIVILPKILDTSDDYDLVVELPSPTVQQEVTAQVSVDEQPLMKPYTDISEKMVDGMRFLVFTPRDAVPSLAVGDDVLDDSTAVLVAQAADVRRDNGAILGAFVLDGELISRGQSKSGFCAIVDGSLTIGVATATPMLEKAIESEGYFFRQYPLVAGGCAIDNRPENKALRKALVLLGGEPAVILSLERMKLNDFSRALVAMGVEDAIYLVGSEGYGFARDASGEMVTFGKRGSQSAPNTSYIVWR